MLQFSLAKAHLASRSHSESKNSGAKGSDGFEGKVTISTDGVDSCQELYESYEFTLSKLN